MTSVCMATHNGALFIRRQVSSILAQLGESDELIISDDESDDGTVSIVQSFKDPRIRLLNHTPCGFPYNFENALKAAKGDYVFLSDQDDAWVPGRLADVLAEFEAGYDLVVVDAKLINESDAFIGESFFALNGTRKGLFHNLLKNSFLGCCMAFRRQILMQALPFPHGLYMHDWWIALIALLYGYRYEYFRKPLHHYRKHGMNLTDGGNKSTNPYWLRFLRRLVLIKQLSCRYLAVRRPVK